MRKSDIKGTSLKQRTAIKKACLENSKWLLAQASDQFDRGNYNLSTFLAITAYEESLKYGLLNFHKSKMITDEDYNSISSQHFGKLLSKYASFQLIVDGKKIKHIYTPTKSNYFKKIAEEIKKKREKALYVDFENYKLNIPAQMNPADATEEMNRASESIRDEVSFEQANQRMRYVFKEIKAQKDIKPVPVLNGCKS